VENSSAILTTHEATRCIISLLSVCLSDDNFRKPYGSSYLRIRYISREYGSSSSSSRHKSKKVQNPYFRNVKLVHCRCIQVPIHAVAPSYVADELGQSAYFSS